jgi:heme/copper-type cytochrome/quinol oxidase subunit 3
MVGMVLVSAGVAMALLGQLAIYLALRDRTGGHTADWLPDGVVIPEIAANLMLIGMMFACVMLQWAVYAVARADRANAYWALGAAAIFGVGVVNAQVYIWRQMELGIRDGEYQVLFYAITGSFLAALLGGLVALVVASFRAFGGRSARRHVESLSVVALYWYVLAAVFWPVWLVVYVVK